MQRVDGKNFRQRLLDLYGSCAVVERSKRAGNVAQDGLARRAKFNAVMIMPRGELLSSAPPASPQANQWRCLKCTCEPRLPSRLNIS